MWWIQGCPFPVRLCPAAPRSFSSSAFRLAARFSCDGCCHICMHAALMCRCMRMCMRVRSMCMLMCIIIHIDNPSLSRSQMIMCYVRTNAHTHTHTFMHAYPQARTHMTTFTVSFAANDQQYMHERTCTCMYMYMHVPARVHTRTDLMFQCLLTADGEWSHVCLCVRHHDVILWSVSVYK
jgi:hypothetical protein